MGGGQAVEEVDVEGTHEGVRTSIHAKRHGHPMLRRARVFRRFLRPKAWYYSLLALRCGGGGRQLCTAGTPRPETKHATHKTHIAWLSSACRRRGIQESHWATALPHNRPSVITMPAAQSHSYAAHGVTLARGCCWASNALPRLLAICYGYSGGGLLVSSKPVSRPPLCFFGLPLVSLRQICVGK